MGLSNRISNVLKTKMLFTLCIEKAQNPQVLPHKQRKGGEFWSGFLVFIIHAGFTADANPGPGPDRVFLTPYVSVCWSHPGM